MPFYVEKKRSVSGDAGVQIDIEECVTDSVVQYI